jgi:hypothetical protein
MTMPLAERGVAPVRPHTVRRGDEQLQRIGEVFDFVAQRCCSPRGIGACLQRIMG